MRSEEKNLARAVTLKTLVNFQEASIVSRTLVDREAGTVTLFAFDKGQGMSEHTAPFDALVEIVDGKAEVTIAGRKHNLQEGEIIVMPANQPHSLKAVERFKMLLTMIRS